MKDHRIILVGILLAGSAFAGQIQIPDWDNSVRMQLVSSQQPVRPGDAFEVAVVIDIEEGYHLYGPDEPEPSRTVVTVAGERLDSGKPSYPAPIERDLPGLGKYDLYEGSIAIRVPVTIADPATDEHEVKATVSYQICTDFACSAPTSDELSLRIPGGAAGTEVEKLNPTIFEPKQ